MVPAEPAATLVAAGQPLHSREDILAARGRARRRAQALKLVRPELERFIRSNDKLSGAVRQLLDDRNIAQAEADIYREMFAAVAYPASSPDA